MEVWMKRLSKKCANRANIVSDSAFSRCAVAFKLVYLFVVRSCFLTGYMLAVFLNGEELNCIYFQTCNPFPTGHWLSRTVAVSTSFFCPCSSWIPWSNVCVCFSSANPGWYAGTFWLWFPPPLGSLLLIAVCLVFLTLFDSLSLESWATIGDERNDFRVQSFDACAFGETVPHWQKEEENMGRSLNGVFLLSFHKVVKLERKKLAPTLLEDERPTMMIARQIERKRKRRKFCKLLGSFATSRCRERARRSTGLRKWSMTHRIRLCRDVAMNHIAPLPGDVGRYFMIHQTFQIPKKTVLRALCGSNRSGKLVGPNRT